MFCKPAAWLGLLCAGTLPSAVQEDSAVGSASSRSLVWKPFPISLALVGAVSTWHLPVPASRVTLKSDGALA